MSITTTSRFNAKPLRHAYAVCIDLHSSWANYTTGDSGFVAYVSGGESICFSARKPPGAREFANSKIPRKKLEKVTKDADFTIFPLMLKNKKANDIQHGELQSPAAQLFAGIISADAFVYPTASHAFNLTCDACSDSTQIFLAEGDCEVRGCVLVQSKLRGMDFLLKSWTKRIRRRRKILVLTFKVQARALPHCI